MASRSGRTLPDMGDGSGDAELGQRTPVDHNAGAYRGFLFADLRGFTAFVESRGEGPATDLLDAYRSLVREQVARHAGAEIRTEGDSFYVVFPSARAAVACGVEIAQAAADYSEQHPGAPIRVGIGINAGEATQHGVGFVGTAVNLAARVCGEARAGEVLVTAPVRDANRGSVHLRFHPRGSRRLKGIAESVPLFAVETAAGALSSSTAPWVRRPRSLAAKGAVASLAVILLAVAVGLMIRNGGLGAGRLDPTSSVPAATSPASTQPPTSAVASDAPFPNQDELALLAAVGADVADCERADLDDRPRLTLDPGEAERYWGVSTTRPPLATRVGASCSTPGAAGPTTVQYWTTSQMRDYGAVDVPRMHLLNVAGTFSIPDGDCAVSSPAYGRWTFAGTEGWLLCRDVYGDAQLEWTYDGRPIVGVASRRDGDVATLYAWWRDNGRFLND